MILSEIHPWQGDHGVMQQLAFLTLEGKTNFEKSLAQRIQRVGVEEASNNGIGAIVILRAIKHIQPEEWAALLRCGKTGQFLYERPNRFKTAEAAINSLLPIATTCVELIRSRANA